MPIIDIEHGSLASSKLLNDNFHSLHSDMQQLLTTLESKVATLQSQLESKINTATSSTKNEVLEETFPIGCIHLSLGGAPAYGRWEKVASDRVIQGSGSLWNPGDNPTQGLPEILGSFYDATALSGDTSGAFYGTGSGVSSQPLYASGVSIMNFQASRSNSTYSQPNGRVQPYAYVVNVWQRVA